MKLLEPKSFDMCKNATTPIITMLGCSELDIEISNADMETMESNDCRELSRDNRDANGVMIQCPKVLSKELTLVLSDTRELDRVPSTE